jgi:hypothetical protein
MVRSAASPRTPASCSALLTAHKHSGPCQWGSLQPFSGPAPALRSSTGAPSPSAGTARDNPAFVDEVSKLFSPCSTLLVVRGPKGLRALETWRNAGTAGAAATSSPHNLPPTRLAVRRAAPPPPCTTHAARPASRGQNPRARNRPPHLGLPDWEALRTGRGAAGAALCRRHFRRRGEPRLAQGLVGRWQAGRGGSGGARWFWRFCCGQLAKGTKR